MSLATVMSKIGLGLTALGGVILIMGLVNLGLTIKDGMQGGGGQLSGAIAMIIGGAIILAAAGFTSQIKM